VFEDNELERTWKPQNFSEKFYGPTRLREAMVNSRNLVSIRLLRNVGIEYARDYITRFGFEKDELPANLSMALGSASLTPLSMARGYAVFANGGYLVKPQYIRTIRDMDGRVVYETRPSIICDDCQPEQGVDVEETVVEKIEPEFKPLGINSDSSQLSSSVTETETVPNRTEITYAEKAITAQNAFLVRSMMMDVVRRGTGVRAMELGRKDLAGKTGTTNEQRDAWFSGYNDHLVTSVWVGFDNHDPLGRRELGGRAALPVWIEFMRSALEGVEETPPVMPDGLAQARIDPETGLLNPRGGKGTIMEIFEADNLPPVQEAEPGENEHAPLEEDPYDIY
jgi:penicillin-binding protein 1A